MKGVKNLKKTAAISAGVMSLTLFCGYTALAADDVTTMAATKYVNVRTEAGMQGKVIGVLSPNEAVKVTGTKDGWYHVVYNGADAYVYHEYLDFEGTAAGEINNGQTTKMKAVGNVYVRADHNNNGKQLGVLSTGEEVNVSGKTGGWYQVDFNGQKGFVYGQYLDFINGGSKETAADTKESGRQLVTTAAVNMRTNSSMNARVIKVVPAGASVTVIDYENGWYRVDYDDDAGCIYAEYLK